MASGKDKDFEKVVRVIASCETAEQVKVASNMVNLYWEKSHNVTNTSYLTEYLELHKSNLS